MIHQVFGMWDGDAPLPREFQLNASKWRSLHAGWKYILWRRQMVEALVAQAPEPLQRAFARFSRGAQRADLARYLILQRHGGIYADLDVVCFRHLDPLVRAARSAEALFFVEAVQSVQAARQIGHAEPIRRGAPQVTTRVANYLMGAAPHAPIFERILALLIRRAQLPVTSDYDVLYTTGPDIVSEVVHAAGKAGRLVLVPQKASRPYFRHCCAGTWRIARDKESLNEPGEHVSGSSASCLDPRIEPGD